MKQLKERKAENEKKKKFIKDLIGKNRTLKSRAFTVREFDFLIKKNQAIKPKILQAVSGQSQNGVD